MSQKVMKRLSWISIIVIIALAGSTLLPDYSQAYAASKAAEERKNQKQEIVGMRTENSKTYIKGDNTYVLEEYLEPIHFKEGGEWEEIDNDIQSVTANKAMDEELIYENKANRYRAGFATDSRADTLLRFQLDNAAVQFSLVDGKAVKAEKKDNQIAYNDVYPDTHLVYYTDNTGVKEEWILDKYNGQSKLTMAFETDGVEAKKQKDGSIDFVDEKGEALFSIPRPFMVDKNLRYSGDVQFTLREEKGQTYLDLELDEKWLQDPDRTYPVTVDPSLIVQGSDKTRDTFVGEKEPTRNFGALTYFTVGNNPDHGRSRALLKFDLQPILSNATITSAKLSVYQTNASTKAERENLHPITETWTETGATWNRQPQVGAAISNQTVTDADWYDFFLTALARDWYSGKTANHGVSIRHATETNDRKSYFSSEYAADPTRKPKLTITYTIDPLGKEEFWTTAASNVNTYNGNFFLCDCSETRDINIPGRGIPAAVERAYNSRSTESGIFGYGWTSNLEQRITDNGHGPLIYTDGDWTTHTFIPNGNGTYQAPPGIHFELTKKSGYILEDKEQTKYQFNTAGRLTSITDANNNKTTISYTGSNPTSITDASGRKVNLTFNTSNRVTKVTDPASRTTEYTYDSADNLKTVTKKDAAGKTLSTVTYGYDADHNLTSIKDANGNDKTVEYDSEQRVKQLSEPITIDGEKKQANTAFQYDATNRLTTVTNPKGTKTVYTHNEYANVTQITQDPNGLNIKQTFTYNDKNELISEKDANANANNSDATYNYTYDDNGNLTSVTNPLKEKSTTEYDENNNPIKVTDPEGNTTTNEFDDNGNLTSTTDPVEKSAATRVDDVGNVIEETAAISPGVNLARNGSFEKGSGSLPDGWYQFPSTSTAVRWANGGLTTNGITLGDKRIEIVNPTEDTLIGSGSNYTIPYDSEQTYFASGIVQVANAQGKAGIQITGYNDQNQITGRIKSNEISGTQGPIRLHAVAEAGAFPKETTKLRVRAYTFHNNGQTAGTYRFDGLQLEEGFLGGHNLLENSGMERPNAQNATIPDGWFMSPLTGPSDTLVTTDAHTGQRSVRLVGEAGKYKSIYQDIPVKGNAGAVFTISGFSKVEKPNPNGGIYGYIVRTYLGSTEQETFTYHFDKSKSHDWQHLAREIKTTKSFDRIRVHYQFSEQSGRAWFDTAKVIPGSITTKYGYDSNKNYQTKTTDPEGRVTESGYDTVGNQTSEKKGSDTTTFAYDGADRLTKVTDTKRNETSYTYDGNGNKTKVTNARGKETTYEYNEQDQVRKIIDALGESVLFAYDINGNLTKMTQPNGNTVEYDYDAVDRQTAISYNGEKKYSFEYDSNSNITKETDESKSQSSTFTYDDDDKLKTVKEPNNNQTDYTYDKNGNVTEQKLTAGSMTVTQGFGYNGNNQLTHVKESNKNRAIYTYNENNQVASRKNEDGTISLFYYNGDGDLVEQVVFDKNGEQKESYTYTYDNKGNITRLKDSKGTTTYVYDELEQLTKETRPDGTVTEYTYDATGNRLTKKVTKGSNTTTTNYTYDDADQLTKVDGQAYSYDKNGNLTSDGKRTYVYDAENRLTTVKEGDKTLASYTYQADGMRKTMTTGSTTITFHYDENNNVTYETNQNNQIVASYTYGANNELVSMTRGGKTYYYQTNNRGDVTAITNSTGAEVATYEYDAFGKLLKETGTVENPYRYAGYRYDEVTGLYYLQSRYYNPDTGRFLTRDLFEGFEDEPLSLNKYAYANNNPVKYIDPNGMAKCSYKYVTTLKGSTKVQKMLLKVALVSLGALFGGGIGGFAISVLMSVLDDILPRTQYVKTKVYQKICGKKLTAKYVASYYKKSNYTGYIRTKTTYRTVNLK
ncbi:DNRLRE domain-containing protein [Desmospora activa]|uniref:RHS repeat-associated protein n=1 Tax=Desmospora activa DSM 45169 TaxID=1121389 RepID=A0A2T4ZBI9_9BACL|nr:DNRLRE domain-containing protein [Desmospora activa]PTM59264.1 RHS repeat-associated protein [Desmospora activa DSM 45169]